MEQKEEVSIDDLEEVLGGIDYETAEDKTMKMYARDRNDILAEMIRERDEELREQREPFRNK